MWFNAACLIISALLLLTLFFSALLALGAVWKALVLVLLAVALAYFTYVDPNDDPRIPG
jgi:hypothetical protein